MIWLFYCFLQRIVSPVALLCYGFLLRPKIPQETQPTNATLTGVSVLFLSPGTSAMDTALFWRFDSCVVSRQSLSSPLLSPKRV